MGSTANIDHRPFHPAPSHPFFGEHGLANTPRILGLFLASILFALPASAAGPDAGWQLRFGGAWVEPDAGFFEVLDAIDRVEADVDSELGFALSIERRFTPRLGLELGAIFAEPDLGLAASLAGFDFSASDSVSFTAITLALNLHLTPGKPVDLYLGPVLAQVTYGDVGLDVQTPGGRIVQDFESDDDFALGAQIGLDIALGKSPWSIALSAKYLDTGLELTDDDGETTDLGFDPLILGVGFGFRF